MHQVPASGSLLFQTTEANRSATRPGLILQDKTNYGCRPWIEREPPRFMNYECCCPGGRKRAHMRWESLLAFETWRPRWRTGGTRPVRCASVRLCESSTFDAVLLLLLLLDETGPFRCELRAERCMGCCCCIIWSDLIWSYVICPRGLPCPSFHSFIVQEGGRLHGGY
jgi:hypothetical protein